MKKIAVFLAVAIFAHSIHAQENQQQIPINISYFGETLIHPGIEVGYEGRLYKWFNYTVSIGTYIHQRHHTGWFLNADFNWRYTFPVGYSPELGIGLGYLHTWQHGGKTYTVDDNGNVATKTVYGNPSFMPTVKIGFFGWDFRKKTNIPMRINLDAIAFGQLPYNRFIMPHFALKAGATYYFNIPGGEK